MNGAVTLAEDVLVGGGVSTVNGKLKLMRGARVDGDLENVNGELRLEAATVRGGIETVNGDVFVGSGSRVDGGIRVEKRGGGAWRRSERLPRITIESGATVNGVLRFEREVELWVASDATVGPVEGVEPKRHALPWNQKGRPVDRPFCAAGTMPGGYRTTAASPASSATPPSARPSGRAGRPRRAPRDRVVRLHVAEVVAATRLVPVGVLHDVR